MNLSSALLIYSGGPGSGCNPAVGKCGRKGTGKSNSEEVEVFYHGTILPSAKAMLKEGLSPQPDKAFKTSKIPVQKGYVYVTSDKSLAMTFAAARAAYDASPTGTCHYPLFWPDRTDNPAAVSMRKRQEGGPAKAPEVPAVVELDIPKKMADKLKRDPDWDSSAEDSDPLVAMIYKGIIPKQYIKKVSVMDSKAPRFEKITWRDLDPKELAASVGQKLYLVYYGPMDALKKHLNAGVTK